MGSALLRRTPLAFAALAVLVMVVAAITLSNSRTSAASDEITIASPSDGLSVPVGNNFTVTLAVTASTALYKSIQWEIAYPASVSFVAPATYTCSQFPSETETQPVEDVSGTQISGMPGMRVLGGGANCASLSGSFNGTNALGVFVTVTLHCDSNGSAQTLGVKAAPADGTDDPFFGTTLGDKFAANIFTTLAPQISTPFG